MIHDLSPWREPDPLRSHLRRRGSLLYRLRIPRRYLTPTRAIAAELSARFRIPLDRITPTPLAAAAPFQTAQTPREPFLLFVGTLESRKNLQLLGALTQFADVRVAGRQPARPTELPPGVQTLGQVSDPELARLYQTAAALVFPSRYEGFGLPILEAMQSGCPVIASKIPALEEVAGDAAVLLPPDAPRLWAETAQKFLHSSALAQDFRQRGLARARLFTWDQTARRTLEAVALTL
jgi:glycosyltransferase involved in cell wall biosynthesis